VVRDLAAQQLPHFDATAATAARGELCWDAQVIHWRPNDDDIRSL